MHPALKRFFAVLMVVSVSLYFIAPTHASLSATLDPSAEELLAMGPAGDNIEQAREAVLAILSQPNSCSAWFSSAEPQVAEKFRSLRFAVDSNGVGEIRKLEAPREESGYYQPYVARTGQNVGWGSTITFNAHGAFFKKDAPVRVVSQLDQPGYYASFKVLTVGGYAGASLQARILTILHELGHIVDLLPLDAGVPSGPPISVRNTDLVIHYCGSQIHSFKKLTRVITASASAPSNLQPPQAMPSKPPSRGFLH